MYTAYNIGEAYKTVSFLPDDPDHPNNWSPKRKLIIVCLGVLAIFNSVFGSSLPGGAATEIAQYFNVTEEIRLALPISVYQVGFIIGALCFGPLSETFGRKMSMIAPFGAFTIFTVGCALAPTWSSLLVFRAICGVFASSNMAVTGGVYADIYRDAQSRGRANALFLASTTIGPQFGPMVAGFLLPYGWRYTFWVAAIVGGVSFILLLGLPETYEPIILQKRAEKLRKESGDPSICAPIELERKNPMDIITVFMARPLRMFFQESIVLLTCLYLLLETGIYYLFFQAYPLIFEGIYGLSAGIAGLAYLPIAFGCFVSFWLFLWYDSYLHRARRRNVAWAMVEDYQRLPLACFGGPLLAISLFWLGWTSSQGIPSVVPMLAGIPFGIGFYFILQALINYTGDAYKTFSASALAAISSSRSIGACVLPLAARPMYHSMGVAWATSLLGLLSLAMSVIPFIFIKYGDRIRKGSRFSQQLLM